MGRVGEVGGGCQHNESTDPHRETRPNQLHREQRVVQASKPPRPPPSLSLSPITQQLFLWVETPEGKVHRHSRFFSPLPCCSVSPVLPSSLIMAPYGPVVVLVVVVVVLSTLTDLGDAAAPDCEDLVKPFMPEDPKQVT